MRDRDLYDLVGIGNDIVMLYPMIVEWNKWKWLPTASCLSISFFFVLLLLSLPRVSSFHQYGKFTTYYFYFLPFMSLSFNNYICIMYKFFSFLISFTACACTCTLTNRNMWIGNCKWFFLFEENENGRYSMYLSLCWQCTLHYGILRRAKIIIVAGCEPWYFHASLDIATVNCGSGIRDFSGTSQQDSKLKDSTSQV